ncbi:MAG: DUF2807 domain-containing protein [Bacteroidales bacterium]|nr:DUF2807 domain-containing protein [Bacteroidales bacterium]MBN2819985.1 DUF2807 domain-containing protein [Bacteroidales bacterium]
MKIKGELFILKGFSRLKSILFQLIFMLMIVSCENNKELTSRNIELAPFNKIVLNSTFDISLNEGNSYGLEAYGDERLLQKLEFEIIDSTLFLGINSHLLWTMPENNVVQVQVNSMHLEEIKAEETSNIKTLTPITSETFRLLLLNKVSEANLELNCNSFLYYNNFSSGGRLLLSGSVSNLKLQNFAIMSVDAKALLAKQAHVYNESQGDCIVNVLESLTYSIDGIGDIHLYGLPPAIEKLNTSSTGRLIVH